MTKSKRASVGPIGWWCTITSMNPKSLDKFLKIFHLRKHTEHHHWHSPSSNIALACVLSTNKSVLYQMPLSNGLGVHSHINDPRLKHYVNALHILGPLEKDIEDSMMTEWLLTKKRTLLYAFYAYRSVCHNYKVLT